jgi:hypothetical protein
MSETIFYVLLVSVLVASVASLLSLNTLLIAFSLISVPTLIIVYKLWYAIENAVFRRTNLVQVVGNQQLSGDRATATRVIKDGFVATAMASLNGDVRESVDRTKIEGIVSRIDYPFRFALHVEKLEVRKMLDALQTKRSMKEIELAKVSTNGKYASTAKSGLLKREIEQIENDIRSISSGTPLRLARYLATSARSESRSAAEERAKSQIRELASEFGALLNSDSRILSGGELLEALEIDSMMA